MSVSITEVINNAGYDPAHNVEDAEWLFAQFSDYDDLCSQAQELLDDYDDYKDYCATAEELGAEEDIQSFEEWRQNEIKKRILKEYNSLQQFNEEWEDYEEPKRCWIIDTMNDCVEDFDVPLNCPFNKEIGNYFRTKEEAEKAVEKLKAWKRLKACGFKFSYWDRVSRDSVAELLILASVEKYMGITEDLDLLFGGEE